MFQTKTKILLIALSVFLSFCFSTSSLAKEQSHNPGVFSIYPAQSNPANPYWIKHQGSTNETLKGNFIVENHLNEPISLQLYFREASNTNNQFKVSENTNFENLGKFLSLEKSQIDLAAKEKSRVFYEIKIPESANFGEISGAIFAQHISPSTFQIPIATRIGIRTFLEIGNLSSTPLKNNYFGYFIILIAASTAFFANKLIKKSHLKKVSTIISGTAIFIVIIQTASAQMLELEITGGGYSLKGPSEIIFDRIENPASQSTNQINFRELPENNFLEIEDRNGKTPFTVTVSATNFKSPTGEIIENKNFFFKNRDNENPVIQILEGNLEGVELSSDSEDFVPLNETQSVFERFEAATPGKWRIFPVFSLDVAPETKSGIYKTTIIFTII
jgi:hypothetical protein